VTRRPNVELISITLPRDHWLLLWHWLQHGDVGAGFGRLKPGEFAELHRMRAMFLEVLRRETRRKEKSA